MWLFHDVQITVFCSVYYDVETTIVAITGFVSTPYTYDVETTIVAITGLRILRC